MGASRGTLTQQRTIQVLTHQCVAKSGTSTAKGIIQVASAHANDAQLSPGKQVQHITCSRGETVGHAKAVIVLDRQAATCVQQSVTGVLVCQLFDFGSVAKNERCFQVFSGTASAPSSDHPFLNEEAAGENNFVRVTGAGVPPTSVRHQVPGRY